MCQHAGGALYHQFFTDATHVAHVHAAHDAEHSHGALVHSHSLAAADLIPNINAAWLAAASIVIKEYLYRATMKVAKERKSSVLASNAVHHRVDSMTSIVALLAIGGAHVFSGAAWLDPVGGFLVSIMVIHAGLLNTVAAFYELVDAGIDENVKGSIRKAASQALSGDTSSTSVAKQTLFHGAEIRDVQGIKSGQNYLVDVEVSAPSTWTLQQLRDVEDAVRSRVGSEVRGVRRVRVKFVTNEHKEVGFSDEFVGADVSARASPEPEAEDARAHSHDHECSDVRKRH